MINCGYCSIYQSIKRTIDSKTKDVYDMFNKVLNAVKKELTQRSGPLPPGHPKYSGQAYWARMLKKRIERSMMVWTHELLITHVCFKTSLYSLFYFFFFFHDLQHFLHSQFNMQATISVHLRCCKNMLFQCLYV